MNTQLLNVLQGKLDNCLYPFFLVPDQVSTEVLRMDMKRLASNGIKGVCVEPNFNQYFAGPRWWEQMDAIMEEARALDMRVWLQDEPTFPTGNANNAATDHPELQKIYLEEKHIDALGPQKDLSFLIKQSLDDIRYSFMDSQDNPEPSSENQVPGSGDGKQIDMGPSLLSVVACKKLNKNGEVDGNYINLTNKVLDGVLTWDVPEGHWRIFIVYTIRYGKGRPNYLNIIDRDAVKLLIETNYESHYKRYAEDFGNTFAGFFSDEPEFGNIYSYSNDNSIGRKRMPLPWSTELANLLFEKLGDHDFKWLPALWYESGECTASIRYNYMDTLTRLFEKNFSIQISDWCRLHNCEYIGHVVEDMGNHAKLGCGVGHYFRAMKGQDYAGIDLVLQQIKPGMDYEDFSWQGGETGGEFFHYGLAKLGSSAAHIDPKKKGRSICEIFAAYGYSLGLKNQKWLFDHMMVRGINNFIPAWNLVNSSNEKCSRYEGDPQFRYNHIMTAYTNRICNLLSNGVHIAPVAVLYHAEAEWSGDYMQFEKPVRVLLQNQIDCDILPADVFAERDAYQTSVYNKSLMINQEAYQALIIPYSRYLTTAVAEFIEESIQQNFPVFFIDALPEGIVGAIDDKKQELLLNAISMCCVVPLESLAEVLWEQNSYEIIASDTPTGLRYYHYKKDDSDLFMFFNEEPFDKIQTVIDIPIDKPVVLYDAFNNKLMPADVKWSNGITNLFLSLHPYQSCIVIFGENNFAEYLEEPFLMDQTENTIDIGYAWELSFADRSKYPLFDKKVILNNLINITDYGNAPHFCGIMRYNTYFYLENKPEKALLSLGKVYEIAEVWINEVLVGVRLAPPYHFDLYGLLKEGVNSIRIEVVNTLVHEIKDVYSKFGVIEPSGLIGPVEIHY